CDPSTGAAWTGSDSLGTIAAGGSRTILITATDASSTPDGSTISNTASASSSTTDPTSANNSATATTSVVARADLADLKVDNPDPVIAGNTLTYTLTVTNNGPSDAQSVSLSDALDSHLTGAKYCLGSGCTPSSTWTGSVSLGTLAAGASAIVIIQASVDPSTPSGYDIHNQASVSSSTTDPNTANNTASADTTVQTQADLQITKTDNPDPVTAGTDLTYTLTVHTAGPSDAQSVQATDAIPPGTTFVSADHGGTLLAGTVTWSLG